MYEVGIIYLGLSSRNDLYIYEYVHKVGMTYLGLLHDLSWNMCKVGMIHLEQCV